MGVAASSSLGGHRLCGEGAQHQQALCVCVCVSENAADVYWVCWKITVVCAVPSHTTPVSHISKQRAPLPSRLCFSASSLVTMDIDVPW